MSVDTNKILEWIRSLQRFGIRPGLDRTKAVLRAFGHPEQSLQFLHVAGTNGKGSVCAFLTALLSEDYVVGTFTSPAFDGYRGRFVIAGQQIEDEEFLELAAQVKSVCEQVTPTDPLTEFEVLTVMAILHFARHHVDVVVWETGLGGRYDSTNVVFPLVTGITNVSLDHTDVLGNTIREIAFDKAGIAKQGVPLVTAATDEALYVIRQVTQDVGASLWIRGVHFADIPVSLAHPTMHYRGLFRDAWDVPIGLFGEHQLENASVALAMYELACERGGFKPLTQDALQRVMHNVRWPGRFERLVYKDHIVILDGAHNPEGAKRMIQSLELFASANHMPARNWTMVIGILRDKDADRMLDAALPFARKVIIAAPDVNRATKPDVLAKVIKRHNNQVELQIVDSVKEAVEAAVGEPFPVCCWGSLYTVHEARNAMDQPEEFKM